MAKLNLTVQQIYDKKFNTDFKGYNAEEVDTYLDLILEDYDTYEQIISEYKKELERIKAERSDLQAQIIELKGQKRANEVSGATGNQSISNVDVLKRLSRLEEMVYKNNTH